jgi:hypothetical protein
VGVRAWSFHDLDDYQRASEMMTIKEMTCVLERGIGMALACVGPLYVGILLES